MGSGLSKPSKGDVKRGKLTLENLSLQVKIVVEAHARRFGLNKDESIEFQQAIKTCEQSIALLDNYLESDQRSIRKLRQLDQKAQKCITELIPSAINVMLNANQKDKKISELDKWLNAPHTSKNHYSFVERRHGHTGEWFIHGDTLKNWLKAPNSSLWVHGIPGSGKSVLLATTVEFISQKRDQEAGLACFYFDCKNASTQSASGMLRALLLQLSLPYREGGRWSYLDQLYRSCDSRTPSLDDLLACLHCVVQRFPVTYILIDALDVCPCGPERNSVLEMIARMRAWDLPTLHLLVTSRDAFDIRRFFETEVGHEIALRKSDTEKDIVNYMNDQLESDPGLQLWKKDRAKIQNALTERAQGVFLYVKGQLRELRVSHHRRDLDDILQSLPRDLHQMYERPLRGVSECNKWQVRRILLLLCYSNRPLAVEELCHACAVDLGKPSSLYLEDRLFTVEGLRRISGDLIEITQIEKRAGIKTTIVNIAHSLLQQYLETVAIRTQEVATFAIDRDSANEEIAELCLVYLKFALLDETKGQRKLEKFPFAQFAAMEWFHYYAACQATSSGLRDLAFDLYHDGSGGCFSLWVELHDVDNACEELSGLESHGQAMNQKGSPIYYSSLLGLGDIADKIMAAGSDINAQGGIYGTALQAASFKGYMEVVQALLRHKANVNAQGGRYGTALQAASSEGHKEIVQVLLDHKADVNALGGRHGSALVAARSKGHSEVMQMLLDRGAH